MCQVSCVTRNFLFGKKLIIIPIQFSLTLPHWADSVIESPYPCVCLGHRVQFSKHRPSGPMLSISRFVRPSVCTSVRLSVCLSVCSLLRYRLTVFLPPLPEVGCPIFLEIQNPWGKVMERSGLRFEHFCLKIVKSRRTIYFFFADFALQNMVEAMLPDGLETSGQRGYR